MSLFEREDGSSACTGGSGGGGGGGNETSGDIGISGTVSAIIIVDDGGGPGAWDGNVVVTNLDDFPGTGTVGVSGNGTGGVSSVTVSSLGDSVGIVVFVANGQTSNSTSNTVGVSSIPNLSISSVGNSKMGVSGYDTADVKITLDGEVVTTAGTVAVTNFPASPANQNVTVTTTSALQTSSIILSAAGDAPQSDYSFIDAPGSGLQIVLYGITGWIAGTATSLAGQLYLHKGNFASGTLVHAAINISQTYQNFSWDTFHGVSIGENVALKLTLLEGSTNTTACVIARYKIEAI